MSSTILIGRTRERPLARILNRTITQRLLDRGGSFELTIVNTPEATPQVARGARKRELPVSGRLGEFGFATAVVAAAVLAVPVLDRFFPVPTPRPRLHLAVLVVGRAVAARGRALRRGAGIASPTTSSSPSPAYTLYITSPRTVAAVLAFLIAGRDLQPARRRDCGRRSSCCARPTSHARALQALGVRLASATDEAEVAQARLPGDRERARL